MENEIKQPGLYRSELEHDACGIGAIVSINGIKTHQTVSDALSIVENLEHRAGKDAEGKTGDGVGILLQISHKFFKKAVKPLGIELGDERDFQLPRCAQCHLSKIEGVTVIEFDTFRTASVDIFR